MAGHSKWANIQHRKGRVDAARGKLWSKLSKAIILAAKSGGGFTGHIPDANADSGDRNADPNLDAARFGDEPAYRSADRHPNSSTH